jgi:hypothetical protein
MPKKKLKNTKSKQVKFIFLGLDLFFINIVALNKCLEIAYICIARKTPTQ